MPSSSKNKLDYLLLHALYQPLTDLSLLLLMQNNWLSDVPQSHLTLQALLNPLSRLWPDAINQFESPAGHEFH